MELLHSQMCCRGLSATSIQKVDKEFPYNENKVYYTCYLLIVQWNQLEKNIFKTDNLQHPKLQKLCVPLVYRSCMPLNLFFFFLLLLILLYLLLLSFFFFLKEFHNNDNFS